MRYVDNVMADVAFTGRTAVAVVRKMYEAAWFTPPGKGAYMHEVARRCRSLKRGARIDPSSPDAFLASLVAEGFLRKEK